MDMDIVATRINECRIHNITNACLGKQKTLRTDSFTIFLDNKATKWHYEIQLKDSILGVFLRMEEFATNDFLAKCDFYILTLNDEDKNNRQFERSSEDYKKGGSYGWKNFVSISYILNDSREFLKNDTLTLRMRIELVKKKEAEKKDTSMCTTGTQYLSIFKEYFNTKSFMDFTFVCSDGIQVSAHRFVLAAFSPVMKAMLETDMVESKDCKVHDGDIDGETMQEIIRFIYTKEVNNIKDLAPKLLYGAEKYELINLKEVCAASMIENLSVENALEYFILADRYAIKELLKCSAKFIKLHHKALSDKNEDWNKLDRGHLIILLEYYQQNVEDVNIFELSM